MRGVLKLYKWILIPQSFGRAVQQSKEQIRASMEREWEELYRLVELYCNCKSANTEELLAKVPIFVTRTCLFRILCLPRLSG